MVAKRVAFSCNVASACSDASRFSRSSITRFACDSKACEASATIDSVCDTVAFDSANAFLSLSTSLAANELGLLGSAVLLTAEVAAAASNWHCRHAEKTVRTKFSSSVARRLDTTFRLVSTWRVNNISIGCLAMSVSRILASDRISSDSVSALACRRDSTLSCSLFTVAASEARASSQSRLEVAAACSSACAATALLSASAYRQARKALQTRSQLHSSNRPAKTPMSALRQASSLLISKACLE